jgi:nucleoside-diphosphate-sugar epimerase
MKIVVIGGSGLIGSKLVTKLRERGHPHAPYFDAELHERTLVPAVGARLAETRFDHWLSQSTISSS